MKKIFLIFLIMLCCISYAEAKQNSCSSVCSEQCKTHCVENCQPDIFFGHCKNLCLSTYSNAKDKNTCLKACKQTTPGDCVKTCTPTCVRVCNQQCGK